MRVGVSIASPSFLCRSNGAGAFHFSLDLATTLRTSEKPLECTPDEARPSMTSPARDVGARQHGVALDRADRKAREIVVVAVIEAGHLRGLAADQRAAGLLAAVGDARDDCGADFRDRACRMAK